MCGDVVSDFCAPEWQLLRASVRGAAHHRSGQPNQDAARRFQLAGQAQMLALADGHGSTKSFRSQCGARLAVLAAQQVCKHLVEFEHLSQCKHWAEEQLPVAVVRQWQERVERRLARQPFTAAELAPLNDAARRQLENQPLIAYGSTLLAVIVAPKFILYLQLGDGDLLTMTTEGNIVRPFAKDARLIANETTSLCSEKAWNEMQICFQPLAGAPPTLILMATDGYANSYRDEESFQQVAREYWELLRGADQAAVKPYLRDWLNDISQHGSGDDISLGLIWRDETMQFLIDMRSESGC